MSEELKRLVEVLEYMEIESALDANIAAFTSGEYKDVNNIHDLLRALEDEVSYMLEDK
jgi:hypothetical protein